MGHQYTVNGEPRHDVAPRKAKEMGLIFSVTEQFKILSKPGLAVWLEKELARAAYNNPPTNGESLDSFFSRLKSTRYNNTSGAAELGSEIHAAIEHCLRGGSLDEIHSSIRKYAEPAVKYFNVKNFKADKLEEIVVCPEHTFAGTADVLGTTSNGLPFVMDWKSKRSIPSKPMSPYDENRWQLASYSVAAFGEDRVLNHEIWACNCFISTTEFGDDGLARFEAYSYPPEEVAEAWKTARSLFELYRLVTGYDPRKIWNEEQ